MTVSETEKSYSLRINIQIRIKQCSPSVLLATFQGVNSYIGVVATILESADIEHFHYHRKFYWTKLG